MTGFRPCQAVIVAFVVVSLTALLVVAGCGSGSSRSSTEGTAASDQPTVTLGGYTFASNSNVLTHPYCTANAASQWVGQGYGSFKGKHMTATFSNGGLVAGVKTLKTTATFPGSSHTNASWLAQDTLGNIHHLQNEENLQGIARGLPAWFYLRRPADLTQGARWYEYWKDPSGKLFKARQVTIKSLSATWRGGSGLLWRQEITDGNGDRIFNPKWGGPDQRIDEYYSPTTHGLKGLQLTATSGYVK